MDLSQSTDLLERLHECIATLIGPRLSPEEVESSLRRLMRVGVLVTEGESVAINLAHPWVRRLLATADAPWLN
jgi:hypothetical protein